jgi:hypothetical protein
MMIEGIDTGQRWRTLDACEGDGKEKIYRFMACPTKFICYKVKLAVEV